MTEPRRALLVCPGRGTYTADDLRTLERRRAIDAVADVVGGIVEAADAFRLSVGSKTVTELDATERFRAAWHMAGDNAGPLIYTCSNVDAAILPSKAYRPVAVCGNSMGWYTALAVGGALDNRSGLQLVDTMSKTQKGGITGGQLIIPWVDEDWRPDRNRYRLITEIVADIDAGPATCAVSIELGGFLVLAGDDAGLKALEKRLPSGPFGSRDYPFRLAQHAAFHTSLMAEPSRVGLELAPQLGWTKPAVSLVDGRGVVWRPHTTDLEALRRYTFVDQVLETYDFTTSLRVALREFAPDVLVLLGPGQTLGGAIGQTLVNEGWRGIRSKADFIERQRSGDPVLLSMGRADQFDSFVLPHLA